LEYKVAWLGKWDLGYRALGVGIKAFGRRPGIWKSAGLSNLGLKAFRSTWWHNSPAGTTWVLISGD